MYEQLPSAEEAAQAGFEPDDYASDPVEIFPDNVLAYEAFNALATQWDYRPCGMGLAPPCGLKYQAIPMAWRMSSIPRDKWDSLYPDIKVMERAALEAMNRIEEPAA